jgi:hypothetical protein
MRTLKTIGIVLGIYVAAIIVDVIVASGSSDYQGGVTILVLLGFLAFMAPKVGYRWFDCFFATIPFYGIFFILRIAHRIAFLPERDWSERVA